MTGGRPFAKNCGHCAKEVGSGVSRAALSNCGDRAQERFGRTTLARDRASTAAGRTRTGQENKRFTEGYSGQTKRSPIGAPFISRFWPEYSDVTGFYSCLQRWGLPTKRAPEGSPFCLPAPAVQLTLPMAAAPANAKCHHHGKSRNCFKPISAVGLPNYMALNSPWGIWPVRRASAAWARTAARSAVDL